MADKNEQLQQLSEQLEQGVKEVFTSGKFAEYLNTMGKFHHYSYRNTILIHLQNPQATYVAGFNKWKELGRSVNKGEHGLMIFAPVTHKKTIIVNHDENGNLLPEPQEKEIKYNSYKVTYVFDISQTNGKELPELVLNLQGNVKDFDLIFKALEGISPYPITFEPIENGANGYCSHSAQKIVIREGVSQEQAVKTAIHEIAHGIMHTPDKERDRQAFEVQAESVAYIVCQHLGIDSSQYSFGYVAGWAADKELDVLHSSLMDIRSCAHEIIVSLEHGIERQRELIAKEQAEIEVDVDRLNAANSTAMNKVMNFITDKPTEPPKSSLIKAGELTKGAQVADISGFLFDVAEVVKQTDKTITVRLCSDFSSFKDHWTIKPDGSPGGVIKTFNKSSKLYGIKAPEPQPKRIADRLKEKKQECDRINAMRSMPERTSRDITR